MLSSTAVIPAWPSPGRFALALVIAFTLTLIAAWSWGQALIEVLLPLTHTLLGWIDDRFGILFLGVEQDKQDTIVRLRVSIAQLFVMGGQAIEAQPQGWLEVTTTLGAMLQPLVIAPAIAAALPGRVAARLTRLGVAVLLALGFLVIDLPLTLYAYVWDLLVDSLDPNGFSPLLAWHEFLHAGGRLGMGILMGLLAWRIERRMKGGLTLDIYRRKLAP